MKRKQQAMLIRIFFSIVILSVLAILVIPKNNSTQPPQQKSLMLSKKTIVVHSITLTSRGFEPSKITIKKGEIVRWTNHSGKTGSVNSAEHPTHMLYPFLNLGQFDNNSSVQATIYRTGELRYVNHYIPSQRGTIIVTE